MMMSQGKFWVGVDPGGTTGIAVWRPGSGLDPSLSGEYTGKESVWRFMETYGHLIEAMQCEEFTISARTIRTAVDYNALHLIGSFQKDSFRMGFPLHMTRPDQVKSTFPDNALRQAKMLPKGGHTRDAARHLSHMLVREGLMDARAFLLTY